VIEALGGLIIAHGIRDGIQLFEADAGSEVLLGVGQRLELVVRCHHILIAVAFFEASPGINFLGGEEAGAVEVEVGGEDALGECVDLLGELAWDVSVAEMLSHHGAVPGLDQGIVVASAGTGFGEFLDTEFLQQACHTRVDVLRAIVGMEAEDDEGKRLEEGFENRQEEAFGDVLDRADKLELGHRGPFDINLTPSSGRWLSVACVHAGELVSGRGVVHKWRYRSAPV